MNRWIRSATLLMVLALAACGDTSSDSPLAPSAPSLDSGLIVGGNGAGSGTAASDTTSTGDRSGLIVGGN